VITTFRAAPDIDVVSSNATIADFGSLAINAFVMHGDEPMLVDTGAVVEADDFMTALRTVIDPTDPRWIQA
jgi:flavorubredoxin